jgi:hypothetical protein
MIIAGNTISGYAHVVTIWVGYTVVATLIYPSLSVAIAGNSFNSTSYGVSGTFSSPSQASGSLNWATSNQSGTLTWQMTKQ